MELVRGNMQVIRPVKGNITYRIDHLSAGMLGILYKPKEECVIWGTLLSIHPSISMLPSVSS